MITLLIWVEKSLEMSSAEPEARVLIETVTSSVLRLLS